MTTQILPAPLNFLALRYLAALCVLFAHSFVISGKLPLELLAVLPALSGIAVLGVTLFFIISGYLVTQSWTLQPQWWRFARKRLLRIYPAMAACLVFSICLGAVATTVPAMAYWQSAELSAYLVKNLLLQNYLPLPGVFTDNPVNAAVNGSLWTIPIEVSCYLAVMVLGLVGMLQSRGRATCTLLVALVCAVAWGQHVNLFQATVVSAALPLYYAAFICGALVFQWRAQLPTSVLLAASVLIAMWALPPHAITTVLCTAALSLLVVNLARRLARHWPEGQGSVDLSYGIYLYAFPIQQFLVQTFPQDNGWANFAKALPLCLACAGLSWYFIERPIKAWRSGRPPARTTPALRTGDAASLPVT